MSSHDFSVFTVPDLATLDKESIIQHVLAVHQNSWNGSKYCVSIHAATLAFKISHSTLSDCWNGWKTCQEAHAHQRLLTDAQEDTLTQWIGACAERGIPITPGTLANVVAFIVKEPIGNSWVQHYLKQRSDLCTRHTQALEKCWASNVNLPTVTKFFYLFSSLIDEFDIIPSCLFNMDEKGVQLGTGRRLTAIVDHDQQSVYSIENGSKKMVMVIECICADGLVLCPNVIFQAKVRRTEWNQHNHCGAR